MTNEQDIDEHFDDDEMVYCEKCYGTGELDCYCGGDLCVCTNYGTTICNVCHGSGEHPVPRDVERRG